MKQTFALLLSITIVCLYILSCKHNKSSYLNGVSDNEKKAALYDESLSKTYVFISGIHQSLYVVINTYENAAFKAKDDYSYDFKEAFENHFWNLVDYNRSANEAFTAIEKDEIFRSTAVCGFMCHDGGPAREEQALAFRKFVAIWFELCSPSRLEYDSYETLIERLNLFRKTLSETMPIVVKHMKSYDKEKYGWRDYTPYKL